MEGLRELLIQGTNIEEIPNPKQYMTKLRSLSLQNCENLIYIADSIGSLEVLRVLSLKGCVSLTEIPEAIGNLKLLVKLVLACTGVKQLPDSINELNNLQRLDLKGCQELETLPHLPCSLTSLKFNGDSMEMLPDVSNLVNLEELEYRDIFEQRNGCLSLAMLKKLKTLKILHSKTDKFGCFVGEEIGSSCHHSELKNFELRLELPRSLVELWVNVCQTLRYLPNLSELKKLSKLCLCGCSKLMEINGIEGAESLTSLYIEKCKKLRRLSGMAYFNSKSFNVHEHLLQKSLQETIIRWCNDLEEIAELDNLVGLVRLLIDDCSALKRIGDLAHMEMLRWLSITNCQKFSDVKGIDKLTSLTCLRLYECNLEIKFLDLSMLNGLARLKIKDEKLTNIFGLQKLKSLKHLTLQGCKSLQTLPDFSEFTRLVSLRINGCENLKRSEGLKI